MIPKIHKKGRSFRGAAQYVLHDIGADTSERVAWSETRNLATQNADAAWRVMAATAMAQAELKKQAGIKNTGRKSLDCVLHVTLSWSESDADSLSREEMMRAASGAIRALGAEDRQALIVCHTDKPDMPHVHLLINRISPDDGRMLSSSKEKLNISKWALDYERKRGEIQCINREMNWRAREERGEYTRGEKNKARNIYELETTGGNDDRTDRAKIVAEQRRKDAEVSRRQRGLKTRQAQEYGTLIEQFVRDKKAIRDDTARKINAGRKRIRESYRQKWQERFHQKEANRAEFDRKERRLLGRIENAWSATDLRAVFSGERRLRTISDVFQLWASKGRRLEHLNERERQKDRALAAEQLEKEREVARLRNIERNKLLDQQRKTFLKHQRALSDRHREEGRDMRKAWADRESERKAAYGRLRTRVNDPALIADHHTEPSGRQTITPSKAQLKAISQLEARMHRRALRRRKQERDGDDRGR